MRKIITAAAQMGAIQKNEPRDQVVERMLVLLEEAKRESVDFVVYPELTLTTFFPRYFMEDQSEIDFWFEKEMPNEATKPLFKKCKEYGIAISFGYAELTEEGKHFNSSVIVDKQGEIIGKYRKIHLPGHHEYDPQRSHQHLEKRYFLPGDLGFPVFRSMGGILGMCICNDRRWPETYRVMGLQGVEMITLGYNTPSVNNLDMSEGPSKRHFHNRLVQQSGAYQNSTWVVGVAKAGIEDGNHMIGGSLIINPNGEIIAEAKTEEDELLIHDCDLTECDFGKQSVFDFSSHRRIEHYKIISEQTGVVLPIEN